jgi:hypothetical protein
LKLSDIDELIILMGMVHVAGAADVGLLDRIVAVDIADGVEQVKARASRRCQTNPALRSGITR